MLGRVNSDEVMEWDASKAGNALSEIARRIRAFPSHFNMGLSDSMLLGEQKYNSDGTELESSEELSEFLNEFKVTKERG